MWKDWARSLNFYRLMLGFSQILLFFFGFGLLPCVVSCHDTIPLKELRWAVRARS